MNPSEIMIVDDNPANLKLLAQMLQQQGHSVRSFPLGRLALAAALKHRPDLILLDINMPEMNGYEVCERLKAESQVAEVPVIFLSALNDPENKVKAFETGAVDYISKPFQLEEVHARVKTHLKMAALQQELKLHNERLEITVAERTRELAESNRRLTILDRSKSDFLNLISHEFRTPLAGLLGVCELLLIEMSSSAASEELRGLFERSQRRIVSILDDALLLTQIDVNGGQFRAAPISLQAAIRTAVFRAGEFAKSRQVEITAQWDDAAPAQRDIVLADHELLVKALHALIETAVKFCEQGGNISVSRELPAELPMVDIQSCGGTIPVRALAKFFELFSIGEAITPGGDLGLGPPMAQRILALFGASVNVANLGDSGVRLTVLFQDGAQGDGVSTATSQHEEGSPIDYSIA